MKPARRPPAHGLSLLLVLAVALVGTLRCTAHDAAGDEAPLELTATIPLPGVSGRIDHLALDAAGDRLFVAALGANTVEVVDLGTRERVARLDGLDEPQGVAWLAERRALVVTNGGAATACIFAGEGLADRTTVKLRADPDNVRHDAADGRIWIGEGSGGEGALGALDPETRRIVQEIEVGGHPESFQLEAKGDRAFVNVPARQEVVVVDRRRGVVVARHRLPGGANYPMALDETTGRLYVAGRQPPRLYVLDTASGEVGTDVDAPGDADDVFVDPKTHRLHVIAGAGRVRVFDLEKDGAPGRFTDVDTAEGARTGLLDVEGRRLFVAAPRRDGADARILVYRVR